MKPRKALACSAMVVALLGLIWLQHFSRDAQRQRLFDASRSGNPPGLTTRLMQARADQLISENEYFGELAHMLGHEPAKAWPWFLEIAQSGSAYGQAVMLGHLAGNPEFSASLSPAQAKPPSSKLRPWSQLCQVARSIWGCSTCGPTPTGLRR